MYKILVFVAAAVTVVHADLPEVDDERVAQEFQVDDGVQVLPAVFQDELDYPDEVVDGVITA